MAVCAFEDCEKEATVLRLCRYHYDKKRGEPLMGNFPVTDEEIRALRVKVLRDLAATKYPRESIGNVAAKHGLTFEDAKALVEKHGWPDPGAMGRSADAIDGGRPAAVVAPQPPKLTPVPKPAPPQQSPVSALVAAGEKSSKARTRRLAAKLREDLKTLQGLVDIERKEAEAARVKAAEAAAIKAEVAELERQLAEKRAQLHPGRKAEDPGARAERKKQTQAIRAWAIENGIECGQFGRLPDEVVMQYQRAQVEGESA